ncbi:MAG: hypothetical protein SD837_01490 [Candidatus Electrothrix scaldis]|nr:MAG: hypothetical protein SD837_01490 [Candidatus Electrothrix sp. GW3-3]
MIYVFVVLSLALLSGVTVFFFISLKSIEVPANVRLVIDAWNMVQGDSAEAEDEIVLPARGRGKIRFMWWSL